MIAEHGDARAYVMLPEREADVGPEAGGFARAHDDGRQLGCHGVRESEPPQAASARDLTADVDVGLVAQLAQPQLALFLGLALADRAAAFVAFPLVRRVVRSAVEDLGDVPAVAALDRLADLVARQRLEHFLIPGHELA